LKLLFYRDLAKAPTCAQKKKKPKKGRRTGAQTPLLPKLGHVPHKQPKKWKKGEFMS
jgi:hypothetical protein